MRSGDIPLSGQRREHVVGRGTGRGRPIRVAVLAARRRAGSSAVGVTAGRWQGHAPRDSVCGAPARATMRVVRSRCGARPRRQGLSPPTSSSVWCRVPGSSSRAAMTAATSAWGDRATGDRGGSEPAPASGRSVGQAARAQDGPSPGPERANLSGGLRRNIGSPDPISAGQRRPTGSPSRRPARTCGPRPARRRRPSARSQPRRRWP
jgi:hypothetical protein